MRKTFVTLALAGSALALSACSQETAEAPEAEATTDAAVAETEATEAASVLDASTATAEDLAGVAGMTPELAAAIVPRKSSAAPKFCGVGSTRTGTWELA